MYCDHCGEDARRARPRGLPRQLEMEPPRFCVQCRRRMKVQVTPRGWTAVCVEHGALTG